MMLNPRTEEAKNRQVKLLLSTAGTIGYDARETENFIISHRRFQVEIVRFDPKHHSSEPSVHISRVLRSLQPSRNLTFLRSQYASGTATAAQVEKLYAELRLLHDPATPPPLLAASTSTGDAGPSRSRPARTN